MNKNKKLLVLLLAPVLALSLAACNNNNNTSSTTSSSTSTSSSTNTSSTTTPSSTTTISSSTSTSTTTPDSSSSSSTTQGNLLDEITGTADERYATYKATANGAVATAYAELVAVETFPQNNNSSNLYLMDGTHAIKAINVSDYNVVQQLEVGKVYKVVGVYDQAKNRLNGKNQAVTFELVEGGETKVQAVKTNLDLAAATTDNFDTVAYSTTGVVTDVINGTTKSIKVEIAGKTYTVQTRGANADAVNEVLMSASNNQKVNIKSAVVYNVDTLNVLNAADIEFTTPDTPDVPDVPTKYKGTIGAATQEGLTVGSVSAEKTLTYTVEGDKVTVGGTDELVAYVKADEATGVTAGNYIGVKITAPADLDASLNPIVVFNSQQLTWTDIASEGSAELKFEVTSITSTYTISVYWEGSLEKAAQVFTVEFATGTALQEKEITIVDSTISELLKKDGSKMWTDREQLYRVEAVVSEITNTTMGNGKVMDPATGEEITLYGLCDSVEVFDNATLKFSNNKTFSSLNLVKGDKVTLVVQYLVYGYSAPYTQEVQGYLEEKVAGVNDVKYTVAVTADAEKGTVELDKTQVALGETAVATVTAKEGWAAAKVEFNGVKLTPNAEGKYEFTGAIYTNSLVVEFAEDLQYDITINTPENGTAELSATKAKIGTEITITVSPAEGYKVDYVKVNGERIRAVDGAYKFILSGTTSVEVAFMDANTLRSSAYVICADKYSNVSGPFPSSISSLLKSGEDIVTSVSATGSVAYKSGDALKFGSSSKPNTTFVINLSQKVTSIIIRATAWKGSTSTLTIDGSVESSVTTSQGTGDSSGYADYTFTFAEGVDTITVSAAGRYLISGLTFLYA
ncbi:MAG TPA: hypothetical protein DCX39_00645 [Firmicutes bacterium]|nr:hypothetical protein [Bacillota bacterium]HAW99671.1 hypothetical protein [Bacillota bacterium]